MEEDDGLTCGDTWMALLRNRSRGKSGSAAGRRAAGGFRSSCLLSGSA